MTLSSQARPPRSGLTLKYHPAGQLTNAFHVTACTHAQALVQVPKQPGDSLTGENIVKRAASLNTGPLRHPLPRP